MLATMLHLFTVLAQAGLHGAPSGRGPLRSLHAALKQPDICVGLIARRNYKHTHSATGPKRNTKLDHRAMPHAAHRLAQWVVVRTNLLAVRLHDGHAASAG